jgi:hypothetical protein
MAELEQISPKKKLPTGAWFLATVDSFPGVVKKPGRG